MLKLQTPNTKLQRSSKLQAPSSKEAPNPKPQIPKKLQIPKSKSDVWNLMFLWSLELGIWSFDGNQASLTTYDS
jgi:hypothetical protein